MRARSIALVATVTFAISGCAFIERVHIHPTGTGLSTGGVVLDGTGHHAAFAVVAPVAGTGAFHARDLAVRNLQVGNTETIVVDPFANGRNHYLVVTDLSADARFVAFQAFDRRPGGIVQIFVYDRQTQSLDRVSRGIADAAPNGSSFEPSLTDNGRYVAFSSLASNLVAGDTNGTSDIFVFDRTTRGTARASTNAAGGQRPGSSTDGSISGDASAVVYRYQPGFGDPPIEGDYIAVQGFIPWSVPSFLDAPKYDEPFSTGGTGVHPTISHNGRYISYAYRTAQSWQQPTHYFITRYDRTLGLYTDISRTAGGLVPTADSVHPTISDDGTRIAFFSAATNLVPTQTDGVVHVYVREVDRQRTRLVSSGLLLDVGNADSGTTETDGDRPPSISDDGRYVGFTSNATNLVEPPAGDAGLYVRSTAFITVDSAAPSALPDGITTVVTITGTGFQTETQWGLSANDRSRWTLLSSATIDDDTATMTIRIQPDATPGPINIVAINPGNSWGPYTGAANWCLGCLTIT